MIVATSRFVVGFGGSVADPDLPGVERPVLGGEAVDLVTGEMRQIDAPTVGGAEVRVASVAADDEGVVVLGETCSSISDESLCAPGELVSFRLDPTLGRWSTMQLPEQLRGHALQYSVSQVLSDGRFVASVRVIGSPGSELLATDGSSWRSITAFENDSILSECATDQAYYRLYKQGGATEESQDVDPAAKVTVRLEQTSLADGATSEVALPPVASAFGGAGIHLGCGPGSPVLSSGTPETVGHLAGLTAVDQLVDGAWVSVDALEDTADAGQVFPGEVVGGPRGVLVGGKTGTAGGKPEIVKLVGVSTNGEVLDLDPSRRETAASVIWKGLSGTLLLIESSESIDTPTPLVELVVWP